MTKNEKNHVLSPLSLEADDHTNMGIPGHSFALFGGCQID
jgi:hypothetical protein